MSDSSLLCRRCVPSGIVVSVDWELHDHVTVPNQPLTSRHFKLHNLFDDANAASVDAVTGRRLVLGNGDVGISSSRRLCLRNAIGTSAVYVEAEALGRRNGVPSELLVRVRITKVNAVADVAD